MRERGRERDGSISQGHLHLAAIPRFNVRASKPERYYMVLRAHLPNLAIQSVLFCSVPFRASGLRCITLSSPPPATDFHIFSLPASAAASVLFHAPSTVNGPLLTITVMTSNSTSAAAIVVNSALVS
jgi:hypothetical protein